ncbi:MAG: hypothetical protein ACYDHW_13090, partial [Syntrophorhabdaceae bacterium]
MNTLKLVTLLVLVLLVGIFAGSLGTRVYLKHELEAAKGQKPGSEEKVARIVSKLKDDLHLDAGQQEYVTKIVTETNSRAEAVRVLYQPELKRIYDQGFERISERLNDGQKKKLLIRQEKLSARYNASYFKSVQIAEGALPDPILLKDRLGLNEGQSSNAATLIDLHKKRRASIIEKYQRMINADFIAM